MPYFRLLDMEGGITKGVGDANGSGKRVRGARKRGNGRREFTRARDYRWIREGRGTAKQEVS